MKRVVLIGGGTGMSTVARYLKYYDVKLSLIVTITDDGGSSGILRQIMAIPPPGDVRNNLVALAEDEGMLRRLFSFRFSSEGIQRHSLGNLIIAGLSEMLGSFPEAVTAASRLLRTRGEVFPVSGEEVHLVAQLDDGTTVQGETAVTLLGPKIRRVFLDRDVQPLPEVLECLDNADIILVGPGSLYTSVISNFLVKGVSESFCNTTAEVAYISNIMTQPGETDGFGLKKHVDTLENYTKRPFDKVFWADASNIDKNVLKEYASKGALPVQNDAPYDQKIERIDQLSVEYTYDKEYKYVIRHSEESIMQISEYLGIAYEKNNKFR